MLDKMHAVLDCMLLLGYLVTHRSLMYSETSLASRVYAPWTLVVPEVAIRCVRVELSTTCSHLAYLLGTLECCYRYGRHQAELLLVYN